MNARDVRCAGVVLREHDPDRDVHEWRARLARGAGLEMDTDPPRGD